MDNFFKRLKSNFESIPQPWRMILELVGLIVLVIVILQAIGLLLPLIVILLVLLLFMGNVSLVKQNKGGVTTWSIKTESDSTSDSKPEPKENDK